MRHPALLAATGIALLATVSACGSSSDHVAPPRVALAASSVPDGVRVGVVVTLSSKPGEGSEWARSAAGAQVAAYQYHLGGHPITLDVVDDKGTAAGAKSAIDKLVGKGVSGIVAATSGAHLLSALADAAQANVPVVLPYETQAPGGDDVWLTGPSTAQLGSGIQAQLDQRRLRRPLVVTSPDQTLPGVTGGADLVDPTGAGAVVRRVKAAAKGRHPFDSVVLAVPAQLQASAARALQARNLDLPVLLGRDALSPAFGNALARGSLADSAGSLAADLTTVGTNAGDVTAVGADAAGDRAAGFYSALRIAAGDPKATGLFGDSQFATEAGSADIASHDAVVAIVAAAAHASSASAPKVLAALHGLRLTGADGLAGPDLDFRTQTAVADAEVLPLHATPQDPGVRPTGVGAATRLFWFAVPSARAS